MTELIMSKALLRMLPVVVNTDPVWFASSNYDLTASLADLLASIVVEAARKLPSPYSIPISLRPVTQRLSRQKCCAAIVQHVQKQLWYLDSLDDYLFLVTVLSVIPFVILSSRDGMIKDMLIAEYSTLLMNHLQQPLPTLRQKQLDACRHATCWEPGNICAVCSRHCHDTRVCDIKPDPQNSALPMHLDILLLKDPFILRNCVVHWMSSEFVYNTPWLNGVMLAKAGVATHTNVRVSLNVCSDCFSSLSHAKVLCLALANRLYRQQLPDQFHDLTWVEEMSSDAAQPFILHATVLPRTPMDINGMLSVIFVGPMKLTDNSLKTMFQVWKKLYPENGAVPGIGACVIYDHESDVHTVFAEETAGFSDHPAEMFASSGASDNLKDEPAVLLESMGVSDPESSKLSGHAFMASALSNLMPATANQPSLIMHRSADAMCEYDNPDLIPGMFPTLFPFSIGGFDDKSRSTPLGFRRQIEYTLDLADKSFCYHRSYMFVTLNIWQCQMAHLHTHFTVHRAHFDTLAKSLASVTATTLTRVAEHLKQEKLYSSLPPTDGAALNLLNKVNTIAARIPGSQSSKIHIWNEIQSYFGYFGVPQLYFTCNPNAAHSPIFQLMCGDETIDLMQRYPVLVSARSGHRHRLLSVLRQSFVHAFVQMGL
ncbi:hypothetical protein BD769DRAFT_1393359 [Suillus cothurnatus]|nr:hypothetical protein BD769DRAFT_1393359 [Suillus cothurnatus]